MDISTSMEDHMWNAVMIFAEIRTTELFCRGFQKYVVLPSRTAANI